MCAHVCVFTWAHVCSCALTCVCMCVHVSSRVCVCVHVPSCACVFMCAHVCVSSCVLMCACTVWSLEVNTKCHFWKTITPFFLSQDLSVNSSSPRIWLEWMSRKPQGSSYLCLSSAEVTGVYSLYCCFFLHGVGEQTRSLSHWMSHLPGLFPTASPYHPQPNPYYIEGEEVDSCTHHSFLLAMQRQGTKTTRDTHPERQSDSLINLRSAHQHIPSATTSAQLKHIRVLAKIQAYINHCLKFGRHFQCINSHAFVGDWLYCSYP